MILQKASSQHIFRLLWCSGRSPEEHLEGSTSQFSSDSYRALMNSPEDSRGRETAQDGFAGRGEKKAILYLTLPRTSSDY